MDDGIFQWDDAKAISNFADHGVTFEDARLAMDDLLALDWIDDRRDYGETRYSLLGEAAGRILYVAYTMRGPCRRIISARSAEPHERRRYHEESRD